MKRMIALAVLAVALPALAQQNCAADPATPGFAPGQAPMADHLIAGQAVELGLKPADTVRFAPPPARKPAPGSFGGIFPLEVKTAGTYRIALSAGLWIDVIGGDGAALVSTEHQHGAPCSGVAKIVAFKLAPGRYMVQLSEAEARAVTAKVMREALLPAG